ncbi:hypothetical protein BC835DRAFT_1317965 [Cytidiella melzeri]|nr:hypothetical protein BC835DRAFT_1317965 [Cytidiella melzeri]
MPRKSTAPADIETKHARRREQIEEDDADEENDDTSMLEMISILQNFQKRTANKSSSKPSVFTTQKNAIYDEARKNASNAVREGVAYIDQHKAVIEALKAQEVSQDQRLKELSLFAQQEDAVRAILEQFPPVFEDEGLSQRRSEIVNETSAMLEAHSKERHLSRKRLLRNAKVRIEEDQERQRIVTDASALIKHYKTLLLA